MQQHRLNLKRLYGTAPPISFCGLFVGAIGKSGRGHGSIIYPIIINYYCLIQTVYAVLNINNSNKKWSVMNTLNKHSSKKKMVGYEYTEQTQ